LSTSGNSCSGRFIEESQLADAHISINDNNATPVVVSLRLRQALLESASKGEGQ